MLRTVFVLFCLLTSWVHAETFRVALEDADNRPFEYRDESKKLTGFHIELVRAVTARLGWDVEFIALPWKRVIARLEHGTVDAAIYVAASPERQAFAYFLPANLLHINGAALFIKKSRADEIIFTEPLEAFAASWKLGFPDGYYMGERIQNLIKQDDAVDPATMNQSRLFSMLQTDRYDAVFGSITALSLAINEHFRDELQPMDNAAFHETRMYISFPHRGGSRRAEYFAAAYAEFRDTPAYRELAHRFAIGATLPMASDFSD